jgi:hypothetical protein
VLNIWILMPKYRKVQLESTDFCHVHKIPLPSLLCCINVFCYPVRMNLLGHFSPCNFLTYKSELAKYSKHIITASYLGECLLLSE